MASKRYGMSDDIDLNSFPSDMSEERIAKIKASRAAFHKREREASEWRRSFYKDANGNDTRQDITKIDKDGSLVESLTKAGFKV